MLLCSRWMRGVFCPSYPNLVRAGCERWCARAKWTYVWHDVDGKIKRGWGWLRKIRGTNWLCQVVNSCECLFFLLVYCKTKKSNVILMTYNNKYNVLFSFLGAFNRNANRCSPHIPHPPTCHPHAKLFSRENVHTSAQVVNGEINHGIERLQYWKRRPTSVRHKQSVRSSRPIYRSGCVSYRLLCHKARGYRLKKYEC